MKRIEAGPAHRDLTVAQKADPAVGVGVIAWSRAAAVAAPPLNVRGCQSRRRIETAAAVGAGPQVIGQARVGAEAVVIAAREAAPVLTLVGGHHPDPGPAVEDTDVRAQAMINTGSISH